MHSYTKTDKHIHHLCQVLAKANRTFVPSKEDDSHTNLYYDTLGNRITGRWMQSTKNKILPTLNLSNLLFEFIDESQNVLESVTSISKTRVEVEKEIEALLPTLGLNADGFTEELHFEIPEYPFAKEHIPALDADSLKVWKAYRKMANEACFTLLGHAQASEEVRIWPHHFDTGIYFKAKDKLGIGFGLAMEDKMAGSPYFYMSAYPEDGEINYTNLPEGNWKWIITDQWKGVILSLADLEKMEAVERNELASSYLTSAFNWIIKQ